MTLTLQLTPEAVSYTVKQLAARIGVEELPVPVHYGDQQVGERGIIVARSSPVDIAELISMPPNSLRWLRATEVTPSGHGLPIGTQLPVLLWGSDTTRDRGLFAERRADGSVLFHADIIAASFFMLTRWEETVIPDRDEHDRFPFSASVAYRQGFINRPIVDEYTLVLGQWLRTMVPTWQPRSPKFQVALSHDIDLVRPDLKRLGGDLLRRHNLGDALKTGSEILRQLMKSQTRSGHMKAILDLAEASRTRGLASAFFFKTSRRGEFDSGYKIQSPAVRKLISDLIKDGHEIGFHPGYRTLGDPELLSREKALLDEVIGPRSYGGRQHYLRFRVPDTWRHWEEVGLTYDSTMGYAGYEGFRCGTCHPYHPFDIEQNRDLRVLEVPLIVMDATLRTRRQLGVDAAERIILELARMCQAVHGTFTILWHNTPPRESGAWAGMYLRVANALSELAMEP